MFSFFLTLFIASLAKQCLLCTQLFVPRQLFLPHWSVIIISHKIVRKLIISKSILIYSTRCESCLFECTTVTHFYYKFYNCIFDQMQHQGLCKFSEVQQRLKLCVSNMINSQCIQYITPLLLILPLQKVMKIVISMVFTDPITFVTTNSFYLLLLSFKLCCFATFFFVWIKYLCPNEIQ